MLDHLDEKTVAMPLTRQPLLPSSIKACIDALFGEQRIGDPLGEFVFEQHRALDGRSVALDVGQQTKLCLMLQKHRLEDAPELHFVDLPCITHEDLRCTRIEWRHQTARNGNVLGFQVHLDMRDSQANCELIRKPSLPVIDSASPIKMWAAPHVCHLCTTGMYPSAATLTSWRAERRDRNAGNQGITRKILQAGWGARIRTWECRYQKPVPYHLATPQLARFVHGLPVLRNMVSTPIKTRLQQLERHSKQSYNAGIARDAAAQRRPIRPSCPISRIMTEYSAAW